MTLRTRIISIMPHGPAYGYYKGARPEIAWDKPGGEVAGFWPREWMDLLGAEILKITERYEWEVWQPDYRADKTYSHKLDTGVTHRLFPAEDKVYGRWPLARAWMASGELVKSLREAAAGRVIVLLYGTCGFRLPFYAEILRELRDIKAPVFMRSGGLFRAPLSDIGGLHRPRTYLELLSQHFWVKAALARADVISEQASYSLGEVRKVYRGRVERLTMGCDFSFWRPPASPSDKAEARRRLGIGEGKKVFFASGNFIPLKQLDKLAEVFSELGERDDFFLLIAGHGREELARRLSGLMAPLARSRRALLHDFTEGESLRDLYWASDVYVSVSTDEGGPASVMKALACGVPVLSTPVGETADALSEYGAGRLVPVRDYAAWKAAIEEVLSGRLPPAMDIAAAKERYDWPNVAAGYVRVFEGLERKYYGEADAG